MYKSPEAEKTMDVQLKQLSLRRLTFPDLVSCKQFAIAFTQLFADYYVLSSSREE